MLLQSFLWILTAVVLIALFGSWVTFPGVLWNAQLHQPPGTPPSYLFGVIWAIMYLLLILSTYVAYISVFPSQAQGTLILIFVAIAILIALWPWVYFYRHSVIGGLIILVILWILAIYQLWLILNVICNPITAALFMPLVLWITYATYLNIGVAYLNPTERRLKLSSCD
jgi:tryptophan-rich sensory protein